MDNKNVQKITILGLIIAFNIVLSNIVKIPIPATNGFVNLVEAGIFIAAFLGGARSGFIVGGFSGLLLDLLAGYPQWMIFSFIIHGLEGLIVGYFGYKKKLLSQIIGLTIGSLIMVIGYVLAGAILYNWASGVASIIGNIAQAVMGIILVLILIPTLKKIVKIDLKI